MEERREERGGTSEMTFNGLLMMLGATGMVQLGAAPDPTSGESRPDLEGAKQTIELLDILKQKTAGNLTESESRLLDDILCDLRLRYVEAIKGR
jgi:hypothetical protein